MAAYKQTHDDLLRHLCEQIQFLRSSAKSYDEGFEGEAKRLAVTIRLLVHDTKKSKSLLFQLNMKSALRMYSTAHPFYPRNLLPYNGLVMMKLTSTATSSVVVSLTLMGEEPEYTGNVPGDAATGQMAYIPRVSGPPSPRDQEKQMPFGIWWNEIVVKDKLGEIFTRKDLVLQTADKEGGAHVDPALDEEYAKLARLNSSGWRVSTGAIVTRPDNSPIAPSIRQIAHELLISIERTFPKICT